MKKLTLGNGHECLNVGNLIKKCTEYQLGQKSFSCCLRMNFNQVQYANKDEVPQNIKERKIHTVTNHFSAGCSKIKNTLTK